MRAVRVKKGSLQGNAGNVKGAVEREGRACLLQG